MAGRQLSRRETLQLGFGALAAGFAGCSFGGDGGDGQTPTTTAEPGTTTTTPDQSTTTTTTGTTTERTTTTPEPLDQVAKLAPDEGRLAKFGWSIALSGDTVLVGAKHGGDRHGVRAGAAHVYRRTAGEWGSETTLLPNDGDSNDLFGSSVALSGDTALVGAPQDEDPNVASAGAAYVFERLEDGWRQTAKLAADDGGTADQFGKAVALSEDVALVGAPQDADPNGAFAGSAYLYARTNSGWRQQAKLAPEDGDPQDRFGSAVSLSTSGSTALVGAYWDRDRVHAGGVAYVFDRAGGEWTQAAELVPDDTDRMDVFGSAVALTDDTALIGAPGDDDPNGGNAGAAYVFSRDDGGWRQSTRIAAADGDPGDKFGKSVALTRDAAIVGAPIDEDPHGERGGSAYAFRRDAEGWSRATKLVAEDGDYEDYFGWSVAVETTTAVVGAYVDDDPNGDFGGSAYVFER